MTLREQIARRIVRRRAHKIFPNGDTIFPTEDALFEAMWEKDVGMVRGIAFGDADECIAILESVDHEFLDHAREGLPLESGTVAKFWLACIAALKRSE